MIGTFAKAALAASFFACATLAAAQPATPVNEATGLPYCSAKMKDRCVQKSDLKAQKAAAKAG